MTNEEAIKVLKTSSWMCFSNNSIKFQEAIGHAYNNLKRIKILSEENTKLKAEIKQLKSELEWSIKLPCKLKDTVYEVVKCDDGEVRIFEMKVCNVCEYGSFHNGSKKKFVWNIYMEDEKGFGYSYGTFYDFGKTIFLSREEAERALKGATNGN